MILLQLIKILLAVENSFNIQTQVSKRYHKTIVDKLPESG